MTRTHLVSAVLEPPNEMPRDLDLDVVRRCTELLEAIVADRGVLAGVPLEMRQALLIAAGHVSRPQSFQEKRLVKTLRRTRRLGEEAKDRESRSATGIRSAREAPVFVAPAPVLPGPAPPLARRELKKPRACYVCKVEFTCLHHFYDALCQDCAEFNYAKRFQTASLEGRVGLVTGSRVKIGFQTSVKMLRAGAEIIATTRFPQDSALRYSREPDFALWMHRLHVHGLDLRHPPSVEIFARYLDHSFPRLDIIVNNACQTVRRPPGFYEDLLPTETRPASDFGPDIYRVLKSHEGLKAALDGGRTIGGGTGVLSTGLMSLHGSRSGIGVVASAELSQVRYAYDDDARRDDLFPQGKLDADLQQVDLRHQNTWRLALADVPTAEMVEVQLVNAVAPFILCARLKSLMQRVPTRDKHIVNVSAMEGIFSRGPKTDKHPHTNMAKAALNMMTLTASRDYVNDGIHMNAVDTGWVTDEDPAIHADRKKQELDFAPPLDIVDGAARVCDPFFSGLITGEHTYGKFLKDYRPSNW
ncbi:MAG: SDR family oxidoreductase [Vicinamibacteria bacterium]|nr:SDR family oxidoreductase [Vicinamibacteria bacterium]